MEIITQNQFRFVKTFISCKQSKNLRIDYIIFRIRTITYTYKLLFLNLIGIKTFLNNDKCKTCITF